MLEVQHTDYFVYLKMYIYNARKGKRVEKLVHNNLIQATNILTEVIECNLSQEISRGII